MSKRQTRRTISLAAAIHTAVFKAAAAEGIAASEYVTRLIRAAIPGLPATMHGADAGRVNLERALRRRWGKPEQPEIEQPRPAVRVLNPTHAPPKSIATYAPTKEIDASFCAVCTSAVGPFYPAPLGKKGAMVAVCRACNEEPARAFDSTRSYEPSGGMLRASDVRAAGKAMIGDKRWERDTEDILGVQRAPGPRDDTSDAKVFRREGARLGASKKGSRKL